MAEQKGQSLKLFASKKMKRLFCATQVMALLASILFAPVSFAQGIGSSGSVLSTPGLLDKQGNFSLENATTRMDDFLAQQVPAQSSTILPTDVLPLQTADDRMSFAENLQLRALQRLPARFYFNFNMENSFRYETNPFQFPSKRKFLSQIFQTTPPPIFRLLNSFQQRQIYDTVGLVNNDDMIYRALPNITGGWTITPRTRIFCNYFMIRDSLFHNVRLNTVIHSISYGIQQDIPVTRRGNLQVEWQARELYQLHQQPVFDFLPALTFSYVITPKTVGFVNTLLQIRGKRYFQGGTREIDPFYTFGALRQLPFGMAATATATLVQNFREPFRRHASIPQNNYSWILDFELAKRIVKQLPGLQAFFRYEPIYNFHSHNRPGLGGVDMRFFWGLRFALSKPPLTAALQQIREQLEEQEQIPPAPPGQQGPGEPKPSAYLMPYQVIAGTPQPIHGFINPVMTQPSETPDLPDTLASMHGTLNQLEKTPSGHVKPVAYSSIRPVYKDVELNQEPAVQTASSSEPAENAPVVTLTGNNGTFAKPQSPGGVYQIIGNSKQASIARQLIEDEGTNSSEPAPATVKPERTMAVAPVVKDKPSKPLKPAGTKSIASQISADEASEQLEKPARQPVTVAALPPAQNLSPVSTELENQPELTSKDEGQWEFENSDADEEKPEAKKAEKSGKNGKVKMILVPPLPRVNLHSKTNPFAGTDVDTSPPIMFNVVR